jgi:GH35 family endo-1,4-beta-xylanase
MKSKTLLTVILAIVLVSCAPAPISTPTETAVPISTFTPVPTETVIPASTFTPIPPTPTITPTPSPENVADAKDLSAWVDNFVLVFGGKVTVNGKKMDAGQLTNEIRNNPEAFTQFRQIDNIQFPFLVVNDVPLAVSNNGKWESRSVISELFLARGILFGFPYDMESNPYDRKIIRPPDDIVGQYSKISFPEDSFYQDFTFKGGNPNWTEIDKYLAFIRKYSLDGGSPHIYWVTNDYRYTADDPQLLQTRTRLIVEHCKNDIHTWNINEIFNDSGEPKSTNAINNARLVIKTVRDTDPTAKIVMNDGGQEWSPQKDKAYFNFIKQLFDEGLLREGDIIGNQAHNGILYDKSPQDIANWVEKYAKLGLNLRFTEADIFHVTKLSDSNEKEKARIFLTYYHAGMILDKQFKRPVLNAFMIFGSTNSSSWLRDIGMNGEYPVILDDNGNPLLSYYLIVKDLFANTSE